MELYEQGPDILLGKDGFRFRAVVKDQTFRPRVRFPSDFLQVFGGKEGNQLLLLRKPSIKLLAEQGDGKQDERQAYDDDREKAKSFVGSHLNPPSCISRQITGFRPSAQGGP